MLSGRAPARPGVREDSTVADAQVVQAFGAGAVQPYLVGSTTGPAPTGADPGDECSSAELTGPLKLAGPQGGVRALRPGQR
jgi:hypothetical protein